MKGIGISAAALVLGVAGVASAAMVSDSTNFSVSPVSIGSNQIVQLDKFDSSLGTLTAVTLTVTHESEGSFLFVASQADGVTLTPHFYSSLTADFNGADTSLWSGSFYQGLSIGVGGRMDITHSVGNPAAFDPISDTRTSPAADIRLYEAVGGGVFDVDISANPDSGWGWSFFGTGAIIVSEDTLTLDRSSTATGTVSVEYQYTTAVPEPTSLALLSLGSLAMIRRKR